VFAFLVTVIVAWFGGNVLGGILGMFLIPVPGGVAAAQCAVTALIALGLSSALGSSSEAPVMALAALACFNSVQRLSMARATFDGSQLAAQNVFLKQRDLTVELIGWGSVLVFVLTG
jgi:hypothetical protein